MHRSSTPTVHLVDDDAVTLDSLSWLFESEGFAVEPFNSAAAFLDSYDPESVGCLVADVCMPEISGIELQEELSRHGGQLPVIFLTGYGDVATCAEAFRHGAFDFLEKPANEARLLDVVQRAIVADNKRRAERVKRPDLTALVESLTPREQQVMDLLIEGKSVKQIAVELQVGFPTAARHRSRVLEKMHVHNDVELVRLVLAPV